MVVVLDGLDCHKIDNNVALLRGGLGILVAVCLHIFWSVGVRSARGESRGVSRGDLGVGWGRTGEGVIADIFLGVKAQVVDRSFRRYMRVML